MSEWGIGASAQRKEDERFLTGRGQYVADFRVPGMREVAFVRSPVAHARIRSVHVPDAHKGAVFAAADLTGVKPIRAATSIRGFKHSSEPILAAGKVRYVGEVIAACLASTRAEAEDIAASIELDLEELPAVTDMLEAGKPGAPLIHEEWGDNVFIEAFEDHGLDEVLPRATIRVMREIRTAR